MAAPPPYTSKASSVNDVASQMQPLNLSGLNNTSDIPTPDKTIVHLKLLHAVQSLRNQISSKEGLYGLKDDCILSRGLNEEMRAAFNAKVSEKRWAVFVTQALDRFTVWWDMLKRQYNARPLELGDIHHERGKMPISIKRRPDVALSWENGVLPPLDILMVWHAFMLNPRCYLEDCLRQGMIFMWHFGMPWKEVDACIDASTGAYTVSDTHTAMFEAATGLKWDSKNCQKSWSFPCPGSCRFRAGSTRPLIEVPWTTASQCCDLPSVSETKGRRTTNVESIIDSILTSGTGYADKDFSATCQQCHETFTHSSLRFHKFVNDARQSITTQDYIDEGTTYNSDELNKSRRFMGGTVLDEHGMPSKADKIFKMEHEARLFPIRLLEAINTLQRPICRETRSALFQTRSDPEMTSLTDVQDAFATALKSPTLLNYAKSRPQTSKTRIFITRPSRIAIRRMMSRYWENSSPFALDLVGAVIRQGSFITKMSKIDWLHSPALTSTIPRLITKYTRFFEIMASETKKNHLTVPTLDVDLAWHTHQLAPASYLAYSEKLTGEFIDHDDKVAETALSDAFARTSKLYQKKYNEPYSECTCWYCEAIRESHTSSVGRLFNHSTAPTIPALNSSTSNDPEKAPHISAHNAIRPDPTSFSSTSKAALKSHDSALDKNLLKAQKRAKKSNRPIPTRPPPRPRTSPDDHPLPAHAYPIAYPIFPYAPLPYAADPCISTDAYASNPSCANFAPGAAGNCAAGSCGGGVAAGSCAGAGAGMGAAGGCVAAGAGGAGGAFGSCAGAGGGGGGGCGGGGGGCGGGGGA
ncbi:MAG: hypothetical protein M1828_007158 [Chrysothrix sp. TS-e1954]|nr:MAG: hypothetical protein M1828_007158 [Chrysothrix sp. TS-e1954]